MPADSLKRTHGLQVKKASLPFPQSQDEINQATRCFQAQHISTPRSESILESIRSSKEPGQRKCVLFLRAKLLLQYRDQIPGRDLNISLFQPPVVYPQLWLQARHLCPTLVSILMIPKGFCIECLVPNLQCFALISFLLL